MREWRCILWHDRSTDAVHWRWRRRRNVLFFHFRLPLGVRISILFLPAGRHIIPSLSELPVLEINIRDGFWVVSMQLVVGKVLRVRM